jgi:plasmid stabilization system protein ParE
MAKRIELSRRARTDLIEIGRFTQREWEREQRVKYLAEIRARLDGLAANPGIGR